MVELLSLGWVSQANIYFVLFVSTDREVGAQNLQLAFSPTEMTKHGALSVSELEVILKGQLFGF